MKLAAPIVAWLEDDDLYREEVQKQMSRELPHVAIHFSKTVLGFWKCLYEFSPRILMVDVMLPRIDGVTRLSEGVEVAAWIRAGEMPEGAARHLRVPEEMQRLDGNKSYATVPLCFVTGRSKDDLDQELKSREIANFEIIEKGMQGENSAADRAVAAIERKLLALKSK